MKSRMKTVTPITMNKSLNDPRILRGMEQQLRLRQERLTAGEKAIGWKIGFGSPAAQERLQLDVPLIGFLTDRTLLPSNAMISVENWTRPAVEPEIAIYLGSDLSGKIDRKSVRAAITALGPAIELADIHFPPDDVEAILTGNIYNRHIVLGHADPLRAGCRLDGLIGRISYNADGLPPVSDLQALTGDMVDIVSYAAGLLSVLGECLRAGEFIIAGSIVSPIWAEPKDRVTYTLEPIDTIAINFY